MNDFNIAGTRQTPTVDCRFSANSLSLVGEAYPENAVAFFEPINQAVESWLAEGGDTPVLARFDLLYLNSASTKMIFKLGAILDAAAEHRPIRIEFHLREDDDMLRDLGDEMKEDFVWVNFEFVEKVS